MSDNQGWQTVTHSKKKKVQQAPQFDPIIARQRETLAKQEIAKQEASKIKYGEQKDLNQDWNYITITKSQQKPKISHPQGTPTSIKETDVGGINKIKRISKSMSKSVVDARVSKQWSQIQLAHISNVDIKIINEIEKGGSIYDSNIFNKVCKALGVNIERNYDLV